MIFLKKVIVEDREAILMSTSTQFNNEIEVNVIDQRFALEHNLELVEASLLSVKWINNNTIFYYIVYLIHYEL